MNTGRTRHTNKEIEKKFNEMGVDQNQQNFEQLWDDLYLHIPKPQDKSVELTFDNNTKEQE